MALVEGRKTGLDEAGWGLGSYSVRDRADASTLSEFRKDLRRLRGVFVVLSLLWGWQIDRKVPDTFDLLGAAICIVGITLIMYAPRGT